MINIAICDDDLASCDSLITFIKDNFKNEVNRICDYSSGEELLQAVEQNHTVFNLFFLDIALPRMDGIQLANALRNIPIYANSLIYFITSYDADIVSVVNVHPHEFIKKPFEPDHLKKSITGAINKFFCDDRYIYIRNKRNTLKLIAKDIVYIEHLGRYSIIHTVDDKEISLLQSIAELDDILNKQSNSFVRIYKSYIVNIDYVEYVQPNEIYVRHNIQLPLGRLFRNNLLEKFDI